MDAHLSEMQNLAPLRSCGDELKKSMSTNERPTEDRDGFFEVRTNDGVIFGPFPYAWRAQVINCARSVKPVMARSLGTGGWDSIYRVKPPVTPEFLTPEDSVTNDEWFRFLRAMARDFSEPTGWRGQIAGFDPIAIEDAGFTCVFAERDTRKPPRFEYENGGNSRASISLEQFGQNFQSKSTLNQILALAEEWEKALEHRRAPEDFFGNGFARSLDLSRFHQDFWFRGISRTNQKGRREDVVYALRLLGDRTYLSIEFVVEEFLSGWEMRRLERFLEIIKSLTPCEH